jgi:hypothetical protein
MDVLMLALVSSEWCCPKKRSYPNLVVSLLGAALGEVPRHYFRSQNSLLLWAGGFYLIAQQNHPKSTEYEHTHPDSSLSVSCSRGPRL